LLPLPLSYWSFEYFQFVITIFKLVAFSISCGCHYSFILSEWCWGLGPVPWSCRAGVWLLSYTISPEWETASQPCHNIVSPEHCEYFN
jgi:hypothetical protein